MNSPSNNSDPHDSALKRKQGPVFIYKDAELREHRGFIPKWLWGVAVVMVCWGIYYLINNWQPPA